MHIFNSAVVTKPAGLVCRGAGLQRKGITVRYGILFGAGGRLCLVDTGYGPAVTSGPRSMPLILYNAMLKPRLVDTGAPTAALASIGASATDVDTIIVTHFHADHVARLNEFPRARIVASEVAVAEVLAMSKSQAIYNGIFTELLPTDLRRRISPFEAHSRSQAHPMLGTGYDLFGDGSYLAVPLPGHANGHFGLYWVADQGPSLYATDAAWTMQALIEDRTPGFARSVVFHNRTAGRATEDKLRAFIHDGGRVSLCHDWELV